MPSKFDEYLNNLSDKDKETLSAIDAKETNDIAAATPIPVKETNTKEPKLDESMAEHIQNVNDGQGNNYQTPKDSLSNYPPSEPQEQEEQNQENTMGNDTIENDDMER